MATMAEISAAINQIDIKKANLEKSFIHLQSQSPSSFNLPFKWSDLDSYFTTLQSSLQSKFNLLQTLSPSSDTTAVTSRPELKSFCQNSDWLGLNRFIHIASAEDRLSILSELPDAYRFSPDAPAMVLDSTASFYRSDCSDGELRLFRSGCLIMLEGLIRANKVISIELKNKAMEIAIQWNQKRLSGSDSASASDSDSIEVKEQTALGFLYLIEAYGLIDRFAIDEVIDCFLNVATVDLCRRIIPADKINDVIQTLLDKDMHVVAVEFSIQLQKTDEFPPVDLLEKRKLMAVNVIEETIKNVKDLHVYNDITTKEINVLKSIIECIDANHLQAEYAKDDLLELVKKLENEVENTKQALMNNPGSRKHPARSKSKSKKLKKSKSKKPTLNILPTIQESLPQKPDLSPDHVGKNHHSPNGSGPMGHKDPCASRVSGHHGLDTGNIDYSFYVPQLQPPSDNNSNGWISD